MTSTLGKTVPETAVIVMIGAAKLFIGDLVEEALEVAREWREDTQTTTAGQAPSQRPLRPRHIREALRRLRAQGRTPHPARRITTD